MKKEYLVMVDMDGTLFDTCEVNYFAYKEALEENGINLVENFWNEKCFGESYKNFLRYWFSEDTNLIEKVHVRKKELYINYLNYAKRNEILFRMLESIKNQSNIALVTTASKKNVEQILCLFNMQNFFDLVITQEDVKNVKPDSECYECIIRKYGIERKNCLILEDSKVGMEAALKTRCNVWKIQNWAGAI